jgi:hypothetical protein
MTYEIIDKTEDLICVYCGREIPIEINEDVPELGDDEAWHDVAKLHRDDCEWVESRAQRSNESH